MNLHEFGLLVIILLLLTSILVLCSICWMKVYKLLYGPIEKNDELPIYVDSFQGAFQNTLDARTIQTRIKFVRKPYKRMKEFQERNMPTIVEVTTPVDSDTLGDCGFEESNEKVSVCPDNNGGVTNYWKQETIIVL